MTVPVSGCAQHPKLIDICARAFGPQVDQFCRSEFRQSFSLDNGGRLVSLLRQLRSELAHHMAYARAGIGRSKGNDGARLRAVRSCPRVR